MPALSKNNQLGRWLRRKFGRNEYISLILAVSITLVVIWLYDPEFNYASLGYFGVFIAALIGNATVILPAPVLVLVFAAGAGLQNPFFVGLVAGVGATLGEITGYLAGYSGNRVLEHNRHKKNIKKAMQERGFWYILGLAFLPNPLFDAAGIVAGALRYSWKKFFLATVIGKTLKMTLVALAGAYSAEWVIRII